MKVLDGQFVQDVRLTDLQEPIIVAFVKGALEEWIITVLGLIIV